MKTVLFQVIQFSLGTHFSSIWPIGPYNFVLQLWAKGSLAAKSMKGYSAFPIASELLEPHMQIV